MASFQVYLWIAIGGAFGAVTRFAVAEQVIKQMGRGFPYATLLVNLVGSFVIGALYAAVQHEAVVSPWRTGLTVGFLGALTTFSTFSLDSILLLQQGEWLKAVANVVLNVIICLFAAWLGLTVFGGPQHH